jgi:hypothetical protein
MKAIYIVGALFVCGILSGCALDRQPRTPEEMGEQEGRMRYMLNETSPRNMTDLPKLNPEFSQTFNTGDAKTQEVSGECVTEPDHIVETFDKKKVKAKKKP